MTWQKTAPVGAPANSGTGMPQPQQTFKPPKRMRVSGSEYLVSRWDIEYDLLSIEEFLNGMIGIGLRPTRVRWGTAPSPDTSG